MAAAADAAAKLVQLGQAEAMPVFDGHQRGVGHVNAHLDDRRAHQHLDLAAAEAVHDGVFFGRRHAAMDQAQAEGLQFAVGQGLVGLVPGWRSRPAPTRRPAA